MGIPWQYLSVKPTLTHILVSYHMVCGGSSPGTLLRGFSLITTDTFVGDYVCAPARATSGFWTGYGSDPGVVNGFGDDDA